MNLLTDVLNYVLGFKPYILLPIIMLTFSLVFKINFKKAFLSSVTIGIGFIGIFVMLDYFVGKIEPAVEALVIRTGLKFNVLDIGWPTLAAVSWSYKITPLIFLALLIVNVILLITKITKTVNVDIWNYWHFIFAGVLVMEATGNIYFALIAAIIAEIVTLKLADMSVPAIEKFAQLEGISISTLSGVIYYPVGVLLNKVIDKIPGLRSLDARPEAIKKKLGLLGEPMVIGLIIGCLLGIGAGYELKTLLELAFGIAAVIYILPMMTGALGKGLMPISDGMKEFIKNKIPSLKDTHIGLDLAVVLGKESIIVTGLLLIPVAIFLAFVLPGMNYIPLGDLTIVMGHVCMVVVACRGNVVRSVLIGIPIIAFKMIISSKMAIFFTELARNTNIEGIGKNSIVTSAFDGGNPFRFWLMKLFQGNMVAILAIPVLLVLAVVFFKVLKKESYNT